MAAQYAFVMKDMTKTFPGAPKPVLSNINLQFYQGAKIGIVGPNGAGKTSLYNCISGLYVPQEGDLRFRGQSILARPAHHRARLGIARMFQNLALYEHLTVLDNMLVGSHHLYKSQWWEDLLWTSRARSEECEHRERVEHIIDFLDLENVRKIPVGILPYGVLKRVELGRALAMKPSLLLLDEPAAGLNREETEDMARYIIDIKEELGVTQLLIEHDLRMVLDLADRIAVLNFGRRIALGSPDEIRDNQTVHEAYLGKAHDGDAGGSA